MTDYDWQIVFAKALQCVGWVTIVLALFTLAALALSQVKS